MNSTLNAMDVPETQGGGSMTLTETIPQFNPHHEPTLRGQYQAAQALELLGECMEDLYSKGGDDHNTVLGGASVIVKLVAADLRRLDEWEEERRAAGNTNARTLEEFNA